MTLDRVFPPGRYAHNPYGLVATVTVQAHATMRPQLPPNTTAQAKDAVATMRPIYDTEILNNHDLRRFVISEFIPECSREPVGGDRRTYAQEIYVRNIPTDRHKSTGQGCESLLSYIVNRLFWDAAEPDHAFAFRETDLKIQVTAPHPTRHVAEVVFSWTPPQGPTELSSDEMKSCYDQTTKWLSETLRTGIKSFGRRYRILFDVNGVIWWGENLTDDAAHWRDLDAYLKKNAKLLVGETEKERSRRFGWMPLCSLIIKCHFVEPNRAAIAKKRG